MQVPAPLKSDRLWDPREVGCCSEVAAVGAEWVAVGVSRGLFRNSTPKFRLLEEAARERADGSASRAAVGKRSRSCWTLGSHVLQPHMWVRLLMRKFKRA